MTRPTHEEAQIDEVLDASFPASDSPPWTLGVENAARRASRNPRRALVEARELLESGEGFEREDDFTAAVARAHAASRLLEAVAPSPASAELAANVELAVGRFEDRERAWRLEVEERHAAHVARESALAV